MRQLLILISILNFITCPYAAAEQLSCNRRLEMARESETTMLRRQQALVAVGAPVSYVATSLAYVAGGIVYVGESIGTFAIQCPAHALWLYFHGRIVAGGTAACNNYHAPPLRLGGAVFDGTTHLREIDLTAVAANYRSAAECFAARNDLKSQEAARDILAPYINDSGFLSHVEVAERRLLVELWESLPSRSK